MFVWGPPTHLNNQHPSIACHVADWKLNAVLWQENVSGIAILMCPSCDYSFCTWQQRYANLSQKSSNGPAWNFTMLSINWPHENWYCHLQNTINSPCCLLTCAGFLPAVWQHYDNLWLYLFIQGRRLQLRLQHLAFYQMEHGTGKRFFNPTYCFWTL